MHAIIAGYGYLGEKIAELLRTKGFALTIIRRSKESAPSVNGAEQGLPELNFIYQDLSVGAPKLPEQNFDLAVFCLAPGRVGARNNQQYEATYCEAQRNFLKNIKASHYIFISSTAVYPEVPGRYEEVMASPHSERAKILLAAEQIALEQKASCVLRLAGLYSAERPIYSASGPAYDDDKMVHFIHRDDAARAVLHAVQNRLQGIYTVHDGHPQLRSTILQQLGQKIVSGELSAQRLLDGSKFFATGFIPYYRDYFAGVRKVQN